MDKNIAAVLVLLGIAGAVWAIGQVFDWLIPLAFSGAVVVVLMRLHNDKRI